MDLKNVCMEMSLKPFGKVSEASWEDVCRKMFSQWASLCCGAERVSVLLWVADGSEILDYSGNVDDEIEWAKYIGRANIYPDELTKRKAKDPNAVYSPRVYTENPAGFTYRSLDRLITVIRSVGEDILKKPVRIGETFDPGPEFAKSPFKILRHPESCKDAEFEGGFKIVSCYSVLNGDHHNYAAFPEGIPDQTLFGEFFAKQVKAFFSNIHFDYLWLSNGFGFGNFPWTYDGMIFKDGKFCEGKIEAIQGRNLRFWEILRRECPDIPIEVRGTNISTGIDLATDGIPLKDIYDGKFIDLPAPNSPWAALNRDIGIELAGWMSHIAELPKNDYSFRFYLHDPWWGFSPWIHCYERLPYDIYLPMAVSRIDSKGRTQCPNNISILSVDDAYGNLLEDTAIEVMPHLREALRNAPDAPGPLVWIYPFEEYHQWLKPNIGKIQEVFSGDVIIRDLINAGFPLNTVCSTKNFAENPQCVGGRILVSPVPDPDTVWESLLLEHAEKGGNVFLYGPLHNAGQKLLSILGIAISEGVEGDFSIHAAADRFYPPSFFSNGLCFTHHSIYSGGGLSETDGHVPLLWAESASVKRTLAVKAENGNGKLVWFRGSVDHPAPKKPWRYDGYINYNDEAGRFSTARFAASLLQAFGWDLRYICPEREILEPVISMHTHLNAFFFTGAAENSLVEYCFRTPIGVPVMLNSDLIIENGIGLYRFPKSWQRECRIFIRQEEKSIVSCCELHPGKKRCRMVVAGLKNAELTVLPFSGAEPDTVISTPDGKTTYETLASDFNGLKCLSVKKTITGNVVIMC